jgi:HEAT repeat protein
MFIVALGKIKSEIAEDVLINLLDDYEVLPYVLDALGRMKSKKAKHKISILTNHSKTLIRKEAQKALNKIK